MVTLIFTFWGLSLASLDVHKGNTSPDALNYYSIDGNTFSMNYFSFFTIQSCLILGFYWIFSGLFHHKINQWWVLKNKFALAVVTYISVTCIIYNTILLPARVHNKLSSLSWFSEMWEHAVFPVFSILYYLFFSKVRTQTNLKPYMKKEWWWLIIYPLAWLVFALVKGSLTKYNNWIAKTYPKSNIQYFNYFFIDLTGHKWGLPNWVWFIVAFFIVLFIIGGLSTLYLLIINKLLKSNNPKIQKLINH